MWTRWNDFDPIRICSTPLGQKESVTIGPQSVTLWQPLSGWWVLADQHSLKGTGRRYENWVDVSSSVPARIFSSVICLDEQLWFRQLAALENEQKREGE
jgi:hypothetical protein